MAGIEVRLFDAASTLAATATTGSNGYYLFHHVPAGECFVEFVAPKGFIFSPRKNGSDDIDSDADPATGRSEMVFVAPGAHVLTVDAGLRDGVPDLAIRKTHAGLFKVGNVGTYVLGIENVGTAPTTGTITVTDPLPTGLRLLSASGSGWDCSGCTASNVVCTRDEAVVAGAPPVEITLLVEVGPEVASRITNRARVAVPDDVNPTNDSDDDSVWIGWTPAPVPLLSPWGVIVALCLLLAVVRLQLRRAGRR